MRKKPALWDEGYWESDSLVNRQEGEIFKIVKGCSSLVQISLEKYLAEEIKQ